MSHETHNGTNPERVKSQVAFHSSFWLIVILVGLFVASLNFINVMGKGEEGKEAKAGTEEVHGEKATEAKEMKEEAKPAAEAAKKEVKEEPKTATTPKKESEHK